MSISVAMPVWASELMTSYQSGAANQFVLYGNVEDKMLLPGLPGLAASEAAPGTLPEFLLKVLLPGFDVILSYDLGNGVRVEKGGPIFSQWPAWKENPNLPKEPRSSVETLTHYFRYVANLSRLGRDKTRVACLVRSAHLVAPNPGGSSDYDLAALALLMREWSSDPLLTGHDLATFLICENLNDLHPLLADNTRAEKVKVPLPTPEELQQALQVFLPESPTALKNYLETLQIPARQLAGATLSSVENLLKTTEYKKQPLRDQDLAHLKKELVEADCGGLIEFIESSRTLDDLHGQEPIKEWLRQDIVLWRKNLFEAMPMGYLLCGPVGTGKTFLVECLAGEAGVPVVKLKNFRDKWVGSTEGNLEKIFRLLQALGRCYVFVDEADQALGKRDGGANDAGLSGRIYSMLAEEMSNTRNRGKVLWILASSRPDLIEVDLKRPGRIDVKIPIFPTTTPEEGFHLIRALMKRRGLEVQDGDFDVLKENIPNLLTPGAAENIAIKVYRLVQTRDLNPLQSLSQVLEDYQSPVSLEIMQRQIEIAVREASDLSFVPEVLRQDAPALAF
jgi:hypothetical protein